MSTATLLLAAALELAAMPGWHWQVTDFEGEARLDRAAVVVPKPAKPVVPASHVAAQRAEDGALTLRFKDSWIAQLRLQGGAPLDLRSHVEKGLLAFDFKVTELSRGGVKFKLGCGKDCERKIPYLRKAQALQGKGWQQLAFPLRCFWREGDDFSAVPLPFTLEGTGTGELSIARLRIVPEGQATASCPDAKTLSVTPQPLEESWAVEWWMGRHEQKLAEIRAHRKAGRRVELLFVGDSITQGWENEGKAAWARHFAKHHAVALGFGGDRTENLLWRLQNGQLEGVDPKLVVMMIGTNNTGERLEAPAFTVAGIAANLAEIRRRLPQAQILLLAIFPRGETPADLTRRHNARINALLPALADGRHIHHLDIGAAFLDQDGRLSREVMPDLLHLSPQAYETWARAIAPTLNRLMSR
jgi:beta-glucosidase